MRQTRTGADVTLHCIASRSVDVTPNGGGKNDERFDSDVSLINWPQNDYLLRNLFGEGPEAAETHLQRARQLSLCLLYWLQTEAPRPDGGMGFAGLRLRGDLMGSSDGLAKMP
ncbi:FAD-dependent oxidoreductase [Stieleria sp. ICT_E10.1]|uniref:FAD-dependent oxidoreductase n=1 Tax=Stieleria sedimenti TaxID=2976331 RepID=UPI00217F7645|nr:FAD-dependent oxidoreductase [Stieleria sedimenti]MCS7465428.1 FAD-dependent oxidoreductase [Stieleria sedimenti]